MSYTPIGWENKPSKKTPINATNLNHMDQGIADAHDGIEQLQGLNYDPTPVTLVAEMTDHNKNYVYLGTETGYEANHWYYWNGSAWTEGGVYNAQALVTDKTLRNEGEAADAKAVGDRLTAIEEYNSDIGLSVVDGMICVTYEE